MDDEFKIPVVDFSKFSLDIEEERVSKNELKQLADNICTAFKTVGFVYLKNYGIEPKKIEDLHSLARQFFHLPTEVKEKYRRGDKGLKTIHGWVTLEREVLNPDRPGDLKEAYNVTPGMAKIWPDADLPGFKDFMMEIFQLCTTLSNRIQFLIGLGLGLKDPEIFRRNHNPLVKKGITTARLLYYPVVPYSEIKPNQIRCGEHSDYGAITLLFQDDVGGLEVKNTKGEFVPAKPIPGTVVVNVADLMQRWTSDQLVSTMHRVVHPTSEAGQQQSRISFVFFVQPDDDCLVECIDGSNKYDPITSGEYLDRKLKALYLIDNGQ